MVCTVCNDGGGERMTVAFVDSGADVEVTLCSACRESFAGADVCRLRSVTDSSVIP